MACKIVLLYFSFFLSWYLAVGSHIRFDAVFGNRSVVTCEWRLLCNEAPLGANANGMDDTAKKIEKSFLFMSIKLKDEL